jgi:flagellar biosynthetic protein FliR
MEVAELIYKNYHSFFFVFIRTLAILLTAPFFGMKGVPAILKIGLSMIIAILLLPVAGPVDLPSGFLAWLPAVFSEVMIGAAIGFVARAIMAGIELAGQVVGFQMGFGIANIIDPHTNNQVSIIASFKGLLATLIFFIANAHHYFISAIAASIRIVPPFGASLSGGATESVVMLSGGIFVIALKIGAPVMFALLFANIAMGIVARTVPQINIFMMGFPVTIAVGLLVLGMSAPMVVSFMQGLMTGMERDIYTVLKAM